MCGDEYDVESAQIDVVAGSLKMVMIPDSAFLAHFIHTFKVPTTEAFSYITIAQDV